MNLIGDTEQDRMFRSIKGDAYSFGIGRTPIFPFDEGDSRVFAKLEYRNRFKSIKDRAAFFMISRGIRTGVLTKEKTVIEASSGNTGYALASISKVLGYRARIYLPGASSAATKSALRSTGQEVVEVHDEASKRGSINIDSAVKLLHEEMDRNPRKYVNFDQYANNANTMAHYYTTGPEAERTVGEKITHVVVAIGTGGTITGLARYFKEINPKVEIVAVMPQPYHKIQGLKNLKVSKTPPILENNMEYIDRWIDLRDEEAEEELRAMVKLGLFVGLSSAANFRTARKIARENPGSRVLTVFPDSAEKYLAEYQARGLFSREECEDHLKLLEHDPPGCLPDPGAVDQ